MKTLHIAIAAAAFAALVAPGRAGAIVLLDQDNSTIIGPGNDGYLSDLSRGQSFTVGIDGTLAKIEFLMDRSEPFATGVATLTVYDTLAGAPNSALGSTTVPASAVSTGGVHSWVGFDVSSLNIAVSAGDVLFAAVTGTGFSGGLYSQIFTDGYAGGAAFACGPSYGYACWTNETYEGLYDFNFRSYVDAVPAPASLALFIPGLAMIAARRRRSA